MKFSPTDFRVASQHAPASLQVVFDSDKTGEILYEIGTRHGLDLSHIGLLSDQVGYVLVGLLKIQQFHDSVMRELNLRPSEADGLIEEVQKSIFEHVKSDLENLARGGAPKFSNDTQATPEERETPSMAPPVPFVHTPPAADHSTASSAWNIPLNPVVTEATPSTPRTLSSPTPTQQPSLEPTPQPFQPKQAAPLPPPPKEELVVPHKSGSQHTSNMPGMRHPWLSDPIKLPSNVAPTPGAVKEMEKKGLTEKPQAPAPETVSAPAKKEAPPVPPAFIPAKPTPANTSSDPKLRAQAPQAPTRAPSIIETPTPAAPLPKTAPETPLSASTPSKPPATQTASSGEIKSTEVIMPGKGVNIPIPKMVSRLPIEERDASRITIVRKQTSEPQATITPKTSPTPTNASITPTLQRISPSTPETPATTTATTAETSSAKPVSAPAKTPSTGPMSPPVITPSKTPTKPSTPSTPIYQGGKDPYREPVN